MKLDLYQVDAFASKLFEGNPAAVCPLGKWLPDEVLQNIAMENNLSETAYFVPSDGSYRLRWFTPEAEVDLCGHATLASAHVLYNHLGYKKDEIVFESNSGTLRVSREGELIRMDFPAADVQPADMPDKLSEALGVESGEVYRDTDYLVVVDDEEAVRSLDPNYFLLKRVEGTRGVIVTAPGEEVDFVSRFFAPAVGVDEDPVTGSAHTMLTPYWAERLGRRELVGRQLSRRGGEVYCRLLDGRVEIAGKAVTYLRGSIEI